MLRNDILFRYHETKGLSEKPSDGKKVIALGMPTLTVNDVVYFRDVAPIRIFLPSLLKTVSDEEWNKFEFVLYIGYDEGDKFFDNPTVSVQITSEIQKMVSGKPVRN